MRRVAFGALAVSTAVHLVSLGGAATGRRREGMAGDDGPISVRYLLPPDREAIPPRSERIDWVRLGSGVPAALTDAGDAPPSRVGASIDVVEAREPAPQNVSGHPEPATVYTEAQVDSAAERDPASAGPVYPDDLRERGVEGHVLVEFTVDSSGRADADSFVALEASDPRFAAAVREALPGMRFRPASAGDRHVAQVVRLPMQFRIVRGGAPVT